MGKSRVLFVDDEPNVLNAIRRSLREFDVHTAESGAAALRLIAESEPFSVIVSDCRMPEMDGIELLKRVATVCPASIRVMLTGNVDQETAVKAVNEGDVFKFLNKPCDPEALKRVLATAVRQHELVTAEKELLEKTLKGTIKVLADLLGIVKPEAFGRTGRLRRMVRDVSARIDGAQNWELDAAVLLSQLGCVNIAEDTLEKFHRGEDLDANERAALAGHPLLGADLIEQIPRLQRVAKIVLYQNKAFDGSGFPIDDIKGEQLPRRGPRSLRCAPIRRVEHAGPVACRDHREARQAARQDRSQGARCAQPAQLGRSRRTTSCASWPTSSRRAWSSRRTSRRTKG